jgi:hypothetical protein
MSLRIQLCLLLLALLAASSVLAQTPVRTETIKPPAASAAAPPQAPAPPKTAAAAQGKPTGHLAALAAAPEIITDLARLPGAVARTRERILTAARTGDLGKLAALMATDETVFTFSDDKDPIAFWKTNYPDSDGLEVLAILRRARGRKCTSGPISCACRSRRCLPPRRSSCSASSPAPTTRTWWHSALMRSTGSGSGRRAPGTFSSPEIEPRTSLKGNDHAPGGLDVCKP